MNPTTQAGIVNKKLLSALFAMAALLVAGGVWAMSSGKVDLKALMDRAEALPPPMNEQPIFKNLDRFVVSLADPATQHYLMLELSLVSHDPRMPKSADELDSVIRNTLIKHFSAKTRDHVRAELRELEALQSQLRDAIDLAAQDYGHTLAVEKVLITNVVIQ